jgi:DNA-binding transcriptional ArsR family regulator
MDNIPEIYLITRLDQVRVLADDIRVRILDHLAREAMTVTQLGAAFNTSRARMHYHVRELEQVELVQLVEKREKGGVIEKYYRAVARSVEIEPELFRSAPHDDVTQATLAWFNQLTLEGMQVVALKARQTDAPHTLSFARKRLWLTRATADQLTAQINALLDTYNAAQDEPGELPWSVNLILYTVPDEEEASIKEEA